MEDACVCTKQTFFFLLSTLDVDVEMNDEHRISLLNSWSVISLPNEYVFFIEKISYSVELDEMYKLYAVYSFGSLSYMLWMQNSWKAEVQCSESDSSRHGHYTLLNYVYINWL